ncbi:MAG TPA: NADH-quinone oxidoreductase subunit A [Phycisphaerae bacterium]|nr:NADH-quinone oxidoreductase subunit A [Phycisphaerae bacterium]HRY67973.1 NADH-quinone oxidoreductase subunit A [Phycisphaerae bacterium]HSA26710.1 NADH-quinone oxidoreductase subunit A [Phycisphaerae bacterium]
MEAAALAFGSFAPVAILLLIVAGMAVGILVVTHLIGPKRSGPVKNETYESGMPLVADARGRFNVRFYLVAILFLLFDIEIVFLWLWAPLFKDVTRGPESSAVGQLIRDGQPFLTKGFMLAEMGLFVAILAAGFAYAWRKGVFRWS